MLITCVSNTLTILLFLWPVSVCKQLTVKHAISDKGIYSGTSIIISEHQLTEC